MFSIRSGTKSEFKVVCKKNLKANVEASQKATMRGSEKGPLKGRAEVSEPFTCTGGPGQAPPTYYKK